MTLDDIAIVTYTNSNCSDVWPMYFGQLDKHAFSLKSYVFSNEASDAFDKRHKFILYENSDDYYQQYTKGLDQISEKYIIYAQEDFIMYDYVKEESIKRYMQFLDNSDYSFVRLVRCGFKDVDTGLKKIQDDIYDSNTLDPTSFAFQMQATIWNKEDMKKLYLHAKSPLWMEPAAPWNESIRELGIKGSYCYNGEDQKGKYHWDTRVFPHIVSAVQKGMWNVLQYDGMILDFLKEYGIDPTRRGMRRVF